MMTRRAPDLRATLGMSLAGSPQDWNPPQQRDHNGLNGGKILPDFLRKRIAEIDDTRNKLSPALADIQTQ